MANNALYPGIPARYLRPGCVYARMQEIPVAWDEYFLITGLELYENAGQVRCYILTVLIGGPGKPLQRRVPMERMLDERIRRPVSDLEILRTPELAMFYETFKALRLSQPEDAVPVAV